MGRVAGHKGAAPLRKVEIHTGGVGGARMVSHSTSSWRAGGVFDGLIIGACAGVPRVRIAPGPRKPFGTFMASH